VERWFQSLLCQIRLVPLHSGELTVHRAAGAAGEEEEEEVARPASRRVLASLPRCYVAGPLYKSNAVDPERLKPPGDPTLAPET
jgi:hypothetical protein